MIGYTLEPSYKQVGYNKTDCRFGQLLFLGLSKCLPESDFYLPRAIGQVLTALICSTWPECKLI